MSLAVIFLCRTNMTAADFASWGWRIPFWVSLALLLFSLYIRMRLNESPLFQQMKEQGKGSKHPLRDSFFRYPNNKYVLLALVGATAGQGVIWYTGQFYALFFLTGPLKLDYQSAYLIIAATLLIGTPFFIFFGWLSDKIGRKPIIMAGCLIAALTYFPLFGALTKYANPALEQAVHKAPVVIVADPATCSFQFNPTGTAKFTEECDKAKALLARAGVPYTNQAAPSGTKDAMVKIGDTAIAKFDAKAVSAALTAAGYPAKADPKALAPFSANWLMVLGILVVLVVYVTMVYGPIAAMLVELFPTRIRYTSMSLPYHIGNGWFGGFLPATAFALVAWQGDIYYGLWYPIVIALGTFAIGMLFVRETNQVDITK
jgi:MFS family permease